MTPAMGAIYDAITDLMDACLKELRRSNKVRRPHVCHLYPSNMVLTMHASSCVCLLLLCMWRLSTRQCQLCYRVTC